MIPEAGVVPAPWQQRQTSPSLCTQIHCMWGEARGWDTSRDWPLSRAQGTREPGKRSSVLAAPSSQSAHASQGGNPGPSEKHSA